MERNRVFKKGDLIWAKIRGYPWWPGIVQSNKSKIHISKEETNKEQKILVNFLGDNTHAEIPIDKVEDYNKKYTEFSKTKKKSLLKAISIANKFSKVDNTNENNTKVGNDAHKKDKNRKQSNVSV